MSETFFRIVRSDPPTLTDFTSKLQLGLVDPGADQYTRWLESGISTYSTEAQARRKARSLPFLGRYVAAVQIEPGAPIRGERTTRSSGHHTLWGEPAEILARVASVVPVE